MKLSLTHAALLLLATLTGCEQGTPGGPGATGEKPTMG